MLLTSLALVVLFTALYGGLFLPHSIAPKSPADRQLAMMTFNLGPRQSRPPELANAIAAEGADIVAVQELVPETVKALSEGLGKTYPYSILDLKVSTTGLLSRYPIQNYSRFQPAGRGRAALDATLNVNGSPLRIMAVHPLPPDIAWYKGLPLPIGVDGTKQANEIADITRRIQGMNGPVVVMGDLNMTDQSRGYAIISNVLQDAFAEAGWGLGFTFPHRVRFGPLAIPGPFLRIDYIFHSKDLRATQARVGCQGGSDHCYLVAQLVSSALK